jgi:hypothetical protein
MVQAARLFIFMMAALAGHSTRAAVYYVNGSSGSNERDGLSSEKALATIQEAASRCAPGDRIVVARGVYYGPIELRLKGTSAHPITLEAEDHARNAVIITNGNQAIREGRVQWEVVEGTPGLYSVPLQGGTARVLYSGTDLQPYLTLDGLKTFVTREGQPGPAHGYFYDEKEQQLYVRLHTSGKYGPTDPAKQVISVGPRSGNGSAGTSYNGPTFFNLGLMERVAAHVVVDGFTFETPGCAGVYVNGNHVTIRNSWFIGCRVGVSGRRESSKPGETSNDVTVEYCDYSQFPAFDDMMEIMTERRPAPGAPKYPLYWWSRKGGGTGNPLTYELGICGLVGSDWTVAHCRVHDAFEGLSTWCVRWSKGMLIHDNIFERLVDNAIEMEDHAEDMRIYHNLITNVVEPLSWQPLGGTPWPGPVYVYENVIRNDEAFNRRIVETSGHLPGWFKAGAAEPNWSAEWNKEHMADVSKDSVRAPGAGVVVFNNTVIYPGGRFLNNVQPNVRIFENFHFINNIVLAHTFSGKPGYRGANMEFRNNLWISTVEPDSEGGELFAGDGGTVITAATGTDWTPEGFLAGENNAAYGKAVPVPEAVQILPGTETISNIGAITRGRAWLRPTVGPQLRK